MCMSDESLDDHQNVNEEFLPLYAIQDEKYKSHKLSNSNNNSEESSDEDDESDDNEEIESEKLPPEKVSRRVLSINKTKPERKDKKDSQEVDHGKKDIGPFIPLKLNGPHDSELRPSPYGPRWGYPAATNSEENLISFLAPESEIMCQMIVGLYDLQETVEDGNSWKSWCSSNNVPEMGKCYEQFSFNCKLGVPKFHLQAVRFKFNVDIAVSDFLDKNLSPRMHKITIFAQKKPMVTLAGAYLLDIIPRELKLYVVTQTNHLFSDVSSRDPPLLQFIDKN